MERAYTVEVVARDECKVSAGDQRASRSEA